MAQPVLIIPGLVVFPGMGAPGFLAALGADSRGFGNLQQIVKLQRLKPGCVESMGLVAQRGPGNALAQFLQFLHAGLHGRFLTEDAKVQLHTFLQFLFQCRRQLAIGAGLIPALHPGKGSIYVILAGLRHADTLGQCFSNVQTGCPAKHHQIQQRIAAQAIGPMHRHIGTFPHCIKPIHNLVIAIFIKGDGLTMHIGWQATHHVMAGWHNGDWLLHRINMGKGLGQFRDAWQPGMEYVFTQMIQLKQHMIGIVTCPSALNNFQHHAARHHIPASQILGVGGISFHESFAVLVDEVATLTPATLGHQNASAGNPGGVKLPHFHILHGKAGTECHASAVTSVHQCIGGGLINAPGTTRCQHCGL